MLLTGNRPIEGEEILVNYRRLVVIQAGFLSEFKGVVVRNNGYREEEDCYGGTDEEPVFCFHK